MTLPLNEYDHLNNKYPLLARPIDVEDFIAHMVKQNYGGIRLASLLVKALKAKPTDYKMDVKVIKALESIE